MNIRSIDDAPAASDYLKALEYEESSREFRPVAAGRVQLTPGGLLQVGDEALEIMDEARLDLAKLARIPAAYFAEIDAGLRAANFNARLPRFHGEDEALEVTVSNDNAIHREPRKGDIVCGGVHLTIEENGAVQVGPESFRLVCRNGAMARVCAGGKHRLRRGQGRDSDRRFMTALREFGRAAWRDWEVVKNGLEALARQPLDRGDIGHIMHGLRQSPFFISTRAARRVEQQLREHGDDLTFYDLHNALTYVGSHETGVLPQYRYRLRLGAGQLARGRAGVCHECRRLMIGAAASQN